MACSLHTIRSEESVYYERAALRWQACGRITVYRLDFTSALCILCIICIHQTCTRVLEYWSTPTTSTSQYFSSSMCILQVQLVITTRVGSVDTSRKCTLRARSMHIYILIILYYIILLQSVHNMHTSQQQSLRLVVVLRTNIIHTCVQLVQYFFGEGFGSAFSG